MSYLLDNVNLNEESVNFHVKKVTLRTWIILIIIFIISMVVSSLVFSIFQKILLITPFILITIIFTPFLYEKLGKKITTLALVKNFALWKEDDEIENRLRRIGNFLLGIKFYPKTSYFLQGETSDLDLNHIWEILKTRVFEIIAASIGIIFGILTIIELTPIYPEDPQGQWELFNFMFFFIILAPLLTFWLVPLIWTAKDVRIRAIDDERTISDMGEALGDSILSDILGLAGLALGFSFLLDMVRELDIYSDITSTVIFYLLAALYLGIFILLITGISLLTGFIYLNWYHEKNVAKTRERLVKIGLPVGVTLIRQARQQELALMKSPIEEKELKKTK
ncbi:MAG: hypothetical protein ACTSR8_07315 [Promethearchaeota archaeon]